MPVNLATIDVYCDIDGEGRGGEERGKGREEGGEGRRGEGKGR